MTSPEIASALREVRDWNGEMWSLAAQNSPLVTSKVLKVAKALGAPADITLPDAEAFVLGKIAELYPPDPRIFRLEIDTRRPSRVANEDEQAARLRVAAMLKRVATELEAPATRDLTPHALEPLADGRNPIDVVLPGGRARERVGFYGFSSV